MGGVTYNKQAGMYKVIKLNLMLKTKGGREAQTQNVCLVYHKAVGSKPPAALSPSKKKNNNKKNRSGIKVLEKSCVRGSVYTEHGVKCVSRCPGRPQRQQLQENI